MDSFSRRPGRLNLVRAKPSPINLIDPQFPCGIRKGLRLSVCIDLAMAICRRIDRQIQGPVLVLFSVAASAPVTLFSRHHKAASKCIANTYVHILHRCVIQQFFHHLALRLNISVYWTLVSALMSDRVWEKPAAARKVPSVLRAISTMVCRKKNEKDASWPSIERTNGLAFPPFVLPTDASSTIKTLTGRRREAEVETRERADIIKQTSPGSSTSFSRASSVPRAIGTMVWRKKNEADVFRPSAERPYGVDVPAFLLPRDASSTIKSLPGRRREAEVEARERAGIINQTSTESSVSFSRNLLKGFEKRHDQILPHTAMLSIASIAINLSFKCSINLYSGRISLIMEERTARNSRNQGESAEVYAASKGLGGGTLNLVFSMPGGYTKATPHEEIYSRNESTYVSPNNMLHSIADSSNQMDGKALHVAEMPRPYSLDLAHVTDLVYAMLERKIKMERERRGIYGI